MCWSEVSRSFRHLEVEPSNFRGSSANRGHIDQISGHSHSHCSTSSTFRVEPLRTCQYLPASSVVHSASTLCATSLKLTKVREEERRIAPQSILSSTPLIRRLAQTRTLEHQSQLIKVGSSSRSSTMTFQLVHIHDRLSLPKTIYDHAFTSSRSAFVQVLRHWRLLALPPNVSTRCTEPVFDRVSASKAK